MPIITCPNRKKLVMLQPIVSAPRKNTQRWLSAVVGATLIAMLMVAGVIITIKRQGQPDTQVNAPFGSNVLVDRDGNVEIHLPGEQGGEQVAPAGNVMPETGLADPVMTGSLDTVPVLEWIPLAPLVQVNRDTQNASWNWDGETAEFGAGKPIARVSIPLLIDGSYELQTRVTIVQAKESTAIYLPISGKRQAVLHIRGDSGNTASPTATMQLAGLDPAPQPQRSASIDVGNEYFLSCTVARSGDGVTIEVHRDEQALFQWTGPVSRIAEVETMHPGTAQLQTAYYTSARFTDLRLRMHSGTATPIATPLDFPGHSFY